MFVFCFQVATIHDDRTFIESPEVPPECLPFQINPFTTSSTPPQVLHFHLALDSANHGIDDGA